MGFEVIPSDEIAHRYDFSLLANARGYRDAVEVGTDLGRFAADFLARFRGHWLVSVDPYEPFPEQPYDRLGDLLTAAVALAPFHGRHRFVRAPSPDCIPFVTSFTSPQFVYIDGAHDHDSVTADLEGWWAVPSVELLAGHDFDPEHPGVVRAVERFARARGLAVRLTHEADAPPSWYVYRREPERLAVNLFRAADEPNPRARPA